MGIKNKHLSIINESGRSMVEVLGTLAIMGVLAIGGIIGYDYGMDKYRANETVNSISLLGIEVISKNHTAQDVDEDELNKPLENEEYIYPTSLFYEAEYDRFGIQITDVPKRVCRLIGDTLADHIETRIEVAESEIDLNKHIEFCNLSDKNTMYFFFEPRKCLPACHANEVCIEGSCQGAECETHDDCNQGYSGTACSICSLGRCDVAMNTEGAECTFDDGTAGQCNQGTCVEKPEEGCTYNINPCDEGLYCTASNTSDKVAFQDNETGICIEPRFDKYPITINGVREIWYLSENPLSWWDATAACEAENLRMVPISHFVNGWNNTKGSFARNERAKALDVGWISIWTTSQTNENKSAFSLQISTDFNNVDALPKNNTLYGYALCRELDDEACTPDICGCTYDINPCTQDFYCAAPNTNDTIAFPEGTMGTCVKPQFQKHTININGITETWYVSNGTLSWWDGMAACEAQNLEPVTVTDLITNSNWNATIGSFTRNDRAKALNAKMGTLKVWTPTQRENRSGFFVNLGTDTKNVDAWSKSGATYSHALCKEINNESCQGCTYDKCTCSLGLYCAASNTSSSVAFQDGETGTCKTPEFNTHVITAGGTTKTWYVSKTPLSWWDASAACAAADLTMVSASDLIDGWKEGNYSGKYTFNAQALALKEVENISIWTQSLNGRGSTIFIAFDGAYGDTNVEAWSKKQDTGTGKTSFYALCKE